MNYLVRRTTNKAIELQVYSDYWIINKTSECIMLVSFPFLIPSFSENRHDEKTFCFAEAHPLRFDSARASTPQPESNFVPLLFSLTSPRIKNGKRGGSVVMRAPGYTWSSEFSLDTANLDGCVEVELCLKSHYRSYLSQKEHNASTLLISIMLLGSME